MKLSDEQRKEVAKFMNEPHMKFGVREDLYDQIGEAKRLISLLLSSEQSFKEAWQKERDDAAKARLALAALPEKLMEMSWTDTEELTFPLENPSAEDQNEWLDTFVKLLENHVSGVVEDALDSLTATP